MSKTILLADDSVTIRKVVELTFMDEDYELDSVGSGEEALERLANETPDLVIADVHMSGVSGYDVCGKVKESDPAPPVLLLVGSFEPFDPADVERCGADRFLKKPFDSQELLFTVRELLAVGESAGGEEAAPPMPSESEPVVEEMPVVAEVDESARRPEYAQEQAETSPIPVEALQEEVEAAALQPENEAVATELSDAAVDRIARRVAELLADGAVRDVAWEVIPDLAEVVIKERLRELESQLE